MACSRPQVPCRNPLAQKTANNTMPISHEPCKLAHSANSEGSSQVRVVAPFELRQQEQFRHQAHPARQQGSRSERYRGQPDRQPGRQEGCLNVAAMDVGQREDPQQNQFHFRQHDQINAANAKPLPAEVVGKLAQPGFVDPARASCCERIEIVVYHRVALRQHFGIAQVPPDVGIGNAAAIKYEDGRRQHHRQQNRKGKYSLPYRSSCRDGAARAG